MTPEAKLLETVDYPGLEIFSEGVFNNDTYSAADLQAMVDAFPLVGFEPTVKAGHPDGQEDEKKARMVFGAPALGYVSRIYVNGKKLIADLKQVPKRFADLIKAGAFKRISAEIYWDYAKKWPRVLKSVAFLGADIPALTDLKAIESLYEKNEAGGLYAYDDNGNEYRAYCMDCAMPGIPPQNPLDSYLLQFPRKSKETVNYTDAGEEDGRCGNCKFYIGYRSACTLVEGWIEQEYVCDYFEARPGIRMMGGNGEVRKYMVEKRGEEWCLIAKSTGKTLGCVVGDTEVWGPKPYRSTARWYEGEIVEISVATGQKLSVTPNHPILTPRGFVPAGLLNKGDQVIGATRRDGEKLCDPDDYQTPAGIKDITASLGEYAGMITRTVMVSPEDFHGDGIGSNVCVIRTDSLVDDSLDSGGTQIVADNDFILGMPIEFALTSKCSAAQSLVSDSSATSTPTHPLYGRAPLFDRHSTPSESDGFASGSELTPVASETASNRILRNSEIACHILSAFSSRVSLDESQRVYKLEACAGGNPGSPQPETDGVGADIISASDLVDGRASLIERDDVFDGRADPRHMQGINLVSEDSPIFNQDGTDSSGINIVKFTESLKRFAGEICIREILNVRRLPFSGHVYNLSTVPGFYVASDIIVHNCHDSKEKAEAQERAVQANKHSADGVLVTLEQMKEICPSCAERMEFSNLKAVRIGKYINLPEGTVSALCDKFGESEGFRTRCMASDAANKVDDPGAFCNALKQECFSDKGDARVHTEDVMVKVNMSREDVGKICPPCAEKMRERNISALKFSAEQVAKFAEMDMDACMAKADMVEKYPDEADRKAACQKTMGKAMMDAVNETKEGGPDMDEKKFEELRAQAKADLEAKEAEIKRDYDTKLADAKKREDDQAAKIKALERQRYDDQNEQWIAEQKKAGILLPVEEPRVRAIFSELFEDVRVVKFSQDGKEASETLVNAVKTFVTKRPSIFKELSHHTPEPGETMDNPGDELDRLAKEYQVKHNVKEYSVAFQAVRKENPELTQKWLALQQ